jgi:hypothetical protein
MECYACNRDRDRSEFAPDRSKASGYKSICRLCDRAKSKRYYAQVRRPARLLAQAAATA